MCNSFIDYFKAKIDSIHKTLIGKLLMLSTSSPDRTHIGPAFDTPSPVSPKEVLDILNYLGTASDEEWIEGASLKAAWWSKPDKLGFRGIEMQSITVYPQLDAIKTAGEASLENRNIENRAVIVDLEVFRITVNPKTMLHYDFEDIRCVEDIIKWTKDRSLWHTACDWRDHWFQPVISYVLLSTSEVGSDLFEYHLGYPIWNPQSTK